MATSGEGRGKQAQLWHTGANKVRKQTKGAIAKFACVPRIAAGAVADRGTPASMSAEGTPPKHILLNSTPMHI
jgi:hypothetical protein